MSTENWPSAISARLLTLIASATLVLGLATLAGAFLYAPADAIQGDVQRIFYIHAPIALASYLAGGVVAICGVIYLVTRAMIWDVIARCSAEIAVLFTSLMLVTGSLWRKPIWVLDKIDSTINDRPHSLVHLRRLPDAAFLSQNRSELHATPSSLESSARLTFRLCTFRWNGGAPSTRRALSIARAALPRFRHRCFSSSWRER